MEGTCQIVKAERHPVRFMSFGGCLDRPGELRDAMDQIHLRLMLQHRKICPAKLLRREIRAREGLCRLTEHGSATGMGVLNIENRVVLGLLDYLSQVEIQGAVILAEDHHEADHDP